MKAQYWKALDPPGAYLEHSAFLADINNERPVKNPQYALNLATLERLVLIRFTEDKMMVPRDSAWFGEFRAGREEPMRETAVSEAPGERSMRPRMPRDPRPLFWPPFGCAAAAATATLSG